MTYRDWGGYGDIVNEAIEDARHPDPLVACPIDGEPLEERDGILHCPRGNFTTEKRHADA